MSRALRARGNHGGLRSHGTRREGAGHEEKILSLVLVASLSVALAAPVYASRGHGGGFHGGSHGAFHHGFRDSSRAVQNDLHLGNRWASELRAEAPADTIAPNGGVLVLPSRHTLNFPGQPSAVSFDHRLSADRMPQSSGQFRVDIDWSTRKAEVHKVS